MFALLRRLLSGVARFGVALAVDAVTLFGWAARSCVEGWTQRSFAAEAAQARDAEAAQRRSAEQEEDEAAHRATMQALAVDTLEATLAMTDEVKTAAKAQPVNEGAVMSERRARQAALKASHEAAFEVRSSRFVDAVDNDEDLTLKVA